MTTQILMTEKDLLRNLLSICYNYLDHDLDTCSLYDISEDQVKKCIEYLNGKIHNKLFDRNNKEEWDSVKDALYRRLRESCPQTLFELTLGLPDGVGSVILDEVAYGRMSMDSDYRIWLFEQTDD